MSSIGRGGIEGWPDTSLFHSILQNMSVHAFDETGSVDHE